MMPLGLANVGDVNVIEKITGRDEVRAHLAELGFVVGAQVNTLLTLSQLEEAVSAFMLGASSE